MRGAKGWSAYAANTIPEGTFVACYIGEQLNRREAERRLRQYDLQPEQHQHALLVSGDGSVSLCQSSSPYALCS